MNVNTNPREGPDETNQQKNRQQRGCAKWNGNQHRKRLGQAWSRRWLWKSIKDVEDVRHRLEPARNRREYINSALLSEQESRCWRRAESMRRTPCPLPLPLGLPLVVHLKRRLFAKEAVTLFKRRPPPRLEPASESGSGSIASTKKETTPPRFRSIALAGRSFRGISLWNGPPKVGRRDCSRRTRVVTQDLQ